MSMYTSNGTLKFGFLVETINQMLDNDFHSKILYYEMLEKYNFFQSKGSFKKPDFQFQTDSFPISGWM